MILLGNWTRCEFGRDILPSRCYIFAGDVEDEIKNSILSLYERYIVSKDNKEDLLLFQVYGASTISDLSYILKDGGIEEIIFIGTAFGIMKGIEIWSYVIPNYVQALDGLIKIVSEENYSKPNEFYCKKL